MIALKITLTYQLSNYCRKMKIQKPNLKSEKNNKIKLPIFFQKSFAKRKQNGYIFTIMLQMIRLWSINVSKKDDC
jgi:hypothetical protein